MGSVKIINFDTTIFIILKIGIENMNTNLPNLKLSIELVPETVWCKNLRNNVSKSVWDTIRFNCYNKYQNKCRICGKDGRLDCHEIWAYDDEKHIQKLLGFVALCKDCHNIKHIGRSGILAEQGKLDFGHLIDHFCQVNNCSKSEFNQYYKQAFAQWHERSQYQWQLDFGEYADKIKK